MKRAKPPVLTSPWKIGFFVSLILVTVSAAVAYFFVRQAHVAWVLPQWTDWNSVVESVMHDEGTIFELWPVVVIVMLTSLLSYLVITQAVRKYKGYLDSGLDYKRLLASIREIQDLEDKDRIDGLKHQPDLRDFLLKIRAAAEQRGKALDAREKQLDKREESLASKSAEVVDDDLDVRLSLECERLIAAVNSARSGQFPDSVDLAIPDLQRIEESMREALANRPDTVATVDTSGLESAFGRTQDAMRNIIKELEAGIQTGREIEMQLESLSSGAETQPDTEVIRGEFDGLLTSLADTQQLCTSLDSIGEDAKGIAINTALKAGSGEGTQSDLIQLADDVKEIAAKFGGMAKSFLSLTDNMNGHVSAIEGEVNRFVDVMNASSASPEAAGAAAGMVSRYVEHLVVTLDKVKGTQTSGGHETHAREYGVNDYGFETAENARPLFSEEKPAAADLPGLQKDRDEVLPEKDKMFADLAEAAKSVADQPMIDHDTLRKTKTRKPTTKESIPDIELESGFMDLPSGGQDPDIPAVKSAVQDEVIDLYALGAVDYDPALHN